MQKLWITLEMIKFEHSVFALPFALMGVLLALRDWPSGRDLFWIIVAMVSARSAAMTFNRIADLRFDAQNSRTSSRALPKHRVSVRFAGGFTIISSVVFFLAASRLHPLAFKLSPLVLAILIGYSYTKRFTYWSHLWLGISLGMAPVGAAVALTGSITPGLILFSVAMMLWVAGFDLIYACQDVEFDRAVALHSFPQNFGIRAALNISRILHLIMLVVLGAVVGREGLGWLSWVGLIVVGVLLAYEHSLVKPDNLSRVNAAFFTVNGFISAVLLLFWGADISLFSRIE